VTLKHTQSRIITPHAISGGRKRKEHRRVFDPAAALGLSRISQVPPSGELQPQHKIMVAGVLECDGAYLVVDQEFAGHRLINQPAGFLRPGEKASSGAMRVTYEQTGVLFIPHSIVGIYHWHSEAENSLYMRLAFTGKIAHEDSGTPAHVPAAPARWLTLAELESQRDFLRNPVVLQCARDHAKGRRFSLNAVRAFESLAD
jgi:ADP-ribose pyrophosphatase YjhB (NUDIX family)